MKLFFLLYLLLPSATSLKMRSRSADQLLIRHLLEGYDSSARPVENGSLPVLVELGLTLNSITSLHEKEQLFTANTWLTHRWVDPRIRWDPREFGGTQTLRIEARRLWLPDIVLYNRADSFGKAMALPNIVASNDGSVYWIPPSVTHSHCKIAVFLFPFDLQVCPLKYGSWTYDIDQLEVTYENNTDLFSYIESWEWNLVHVGTRKQYHVYKNPGRTFSDITFFICISRKSLFYWINVVIPSICLNVLCIVSFQVPPLANGRIVLSITTMISYFVYGNLLMDTLPRSHILPVLGVYLFISMSISVWSVILSVGAVRLFSDRQTQLKVPRWMTWLLLDRCACIRGPPIKEEKSIQAALKNFYGGSVGKKHAIFKKKIAQESEEEEEEVDSAQTQLKRLLKDMLLLAEKHRRNLEERVRSTGHPDRTHLTINNAGDATEAEDGQTWYKLGVLVNCIGYLCSLMLFFTAITFFIYMYWSVRAKDAQMAWCQSVIERAARTTITHHNYMRDDFSMN